MGMDVVFRVIFVTAYCVSTIIFTLRANVEQLWILLNFIILFFHKIV